MAALHTADEETQKHPAHPQAHARHLSWSDFADTVEAPTLKRSVVRPVPPVGINPTRLEQIIARLDRLSPGHGEELMRIFSFLVIGGSASFVNLLGVFILDRIFRPTPNATLLYVIISALATEVSLIYNYYLNDRYTFHSLIDASRSWLQRCIRFHGPASVGFLLTIAISTGLFKLTHVPVASQGIAIVIVTGVNFLMHRFWTYRPTTPSEQAA